MSAAAATPRIVPHVLNTVDFPVKGWYNRHAKATGFIFGFIGGLT